MPAESKRFSAIDFYVCVDKLTKEWADESYATFIETVVLAWSGSLSIKINCKE
jgi:hypothetical protein